jgi:hypothetical protein
MKKISMNLGSAAFVITTIFFNTQAAGAENLNSRHNSEHKLGAVTNYGDGIVMSDYADESGFEVEGGGVRFIYDKHMKVMTCISNDGVAQTCFSQIEANATPDAFSLAGNHQ